MQYAAPLAAEAALEKYKSTQWNCHKPRTRQIYESWFGRWNAFVAATGCTWLVTYIRLRAFITYCDGEDPLFPPSLEQLIKSLVNLAQRQFVELRMEIEAAFTPFVTSKNNQ